ncbi:MAG: tetratricopeptide repeat protein [Edaphocola sp.]
MKPIQYIVIAAALALTAGLYWGGKTVAPKKEKPEAGTMAAGGGTAGDMQAAAMNLPEPARFDTLLAGAKKKISPAAQAEISRQENTITRGNVQEQQAQAYEALGKLWQQNKNKAVAAYYFAESGKLDNSQKKLNFAAHLMWEELQDEANPNKRQWMAHVAADCYRKSLELDPDNDTARINLAEMYINGSGETMKGIEQLLSIVRKDSTNIPANTILGRMAVESGQLDKAVQRGYTILRVDKNNVEARLFTAEALKRQGQAAKAKELLKEAQKLVKEPSFVKDLDDYMKTF